MMATFLFCFICQQQHWTDTFSTNFVSIACLFVFLSEDVLCFIYGSAGLGLTGDLFYFYVQFFTLAAANLSFCLV